MITQDAIRPTRSAGEPLLPGREDQSTPCPETASRDSPPAHGEPGDGRAKMVREGAPLAAGEASCLSPPGWKRSK